MGSNLITGRTGSFLIVPVTVDADGHLQIDALSIPNVVLAAGVAHIGQVALDAEIPAGTKHIGQVSLDAAIPAGTNLLGDIGIDGYYNSAWRKAPIPWGASADYGAAFSNLTLPAGSSSQDFPALTANAFTVITNWSVAYVGTITGVSVNLIRRAGGTTDYLVAKYNAPVISGNYFLWNGFLVCKSSDVLRMNVFGATLNDDLLASINGYYISLNL